MAGSGEGLGSFPVDGRLELTGLRPGARYELVAQTESILGVKELSAEPIVVTMGRKMHFSYLLSE